MKIKQREAKKQQKLDAEKQDDGWIQVQGQVDDQV